MFNSHRSYSRYAWAGCGVIALLAGCGKSADPAAEPATSESAKLSPSEQEGNSTPTVVLEPPETIASSPVVLPSDDRYATNKKPISKSIEVKPWTGPRPELPIYPLTMEQFNAAWEIDLDVTEEPLGKVISQIVADVPNWQPQLLLANNEQNAGTDDAPSGMLEKPITLKLEKVSRLEAIERACEAAGVYPDYGFEREFAADSKPTIRLHPGTRSQKFGGVETSGSSQLVVFVGPQMIELSKVQEFPPYAVGSLELKMLSLPLPSPVRNLQEGPVCNFERVLLADGRDIHAGHGGPTRVIVPTIMDVSTESLQLKDLLQDVKQIAEVQGFVKLPIPLQTSVAWLDSLAEGYQTQTDQLAVTLLTNSATPGSWYLRYEVVSQSSLEGLTAFAFDDQGKLIETDSFGTSWAPGINQGTGSINLSREPRMLAVVVIDKQSVFESTFALKDIPLTKSEEQPAKLPELVYEGFDHPLTISVGQLKREAIFKEAELTMVNHANKDIREIELTMHYLDAQGNKLRDNPTSIAAKYDDRQVPYPILLKAGGTKKMMQTAYLCPDETTQIKITVTSIQFADRDLWTAEPAR